MSHPFYTLTDQRQQTELRQRMIAAGQWCMMPSDVAEIESILAMPSCIPVALPPLYESEYFECLSYILGQSEADGEAVPFEQAEARALRYAVKMMVWDRRGMNG